MQHHYEALKFPHHVSAFSESKALAAMLTPWLVLQAIPEA